jgi:hypothetical protein
MLDMKLLTATATGQGIRDNDFDWTVEGELVWLGFVCDNDRPGSRPPPITGRRR